MNQLAKIGILGSIFLCLTSDVQARDNEKFHCYEMMGQNYKRIEQLERENMSLRRQVEQLRYQQQRQGSYGVPYRYGSRPLQGANQSLRDLEQTTRHLKNLTR